MRDDGRRRRRAPSALGAIFLAAAMVPPAAAGVPDGPPAAEPAACADCHDAAAGFDASVHGKAGLECASCHTDLAQAAGFPHPEPVPVDCTACHEATISREHPPTCADCHGGHDIKKVTGSVRSAAADRLAGTCGKCHEGPARDFAAGIHGGELAKGNPDVPTCLTCHGGHGIRLNDDPDSPVGPASQARTCARCHDDEEIASKYHLPPARLQTFVGSYHGLASEYGERNVANCASCHGAHRILPSTDPASTIHASNLPGTCGACHAQAGSHFAEGKVHVEDRWEDNKYAYVARRFYQGMIGSMMAVFAVFMVVDFTYRVRRRNGRPPRGREAP